MGTATKTATKIATNTATTERAADIVHRAFEDYHALFRTITRRAKERFERQDWDGIRRDTVKRLALHKQSLGETEESLHLTCGDGVAGREMLAAMKEAYTRAILGRDDFEIAQTYFNSLVRRLHPHAGVDPDIDYVASDFPLPFGGWEMASARLYAVRSLDGPVIVKILRDAGFHRPFADLERDGERVAARLVSVLEQRYGGTEIDALDVLRPIFVRNKAAYVVGRARRGREILPVVLVVVHETEGLVIDAVLWAEEDVSVVFSFARWYFHADLASPRQVIGFLHSLLPRKRVAELYISLGYNKHGKTELYSDLLKVITNSQDRFVRAPGTRGLVMAVFTLPSYEFVFKVIKDSFPPSKKTTRRQVMAKYREVLQHDRVGRLVDFQEFEDLVFPRHRFSDEMLDELLSVAGKTVWLDGDRVVINHLYVGRRVTPLDVFLRTAEPAAAEAAVRDWGQTLKDLAAANIFAGDMLLKNFGVTRHGRVVFYDYDELCPLVDCNFRALPVARDPIEELAAEPFYAIADHDVFPEEFVTFIELRGPLRQTFDELHGDLMTTELWRGMQQRNRAGELIDFYPYTQAQRLGP